MTDSGRDERGSGVEDPFAGDPGYYGPPVSFGPGYPAPPQPEVNKLATLSVVFAFVFAPVGAVLGHLALAELTRGGDREPGRSRAVLGLTLSYAISALALVVLAAWLIVAPHLGGPDAAVVTTAEQPAPVISSTVVTPPPRSRPTIDVGHLRPGDCVEIQNNKPAADQPNTDYVFIYRVPCEAREGVFQVRQLVSTEDQCTTRNAIFNTTRTVFACVADFRG